MQPILCSVPTLAVSLIYCCYHAYLQALRPRDRLLRERVAYMLWVMAGCGSPDPGGPE
jgi:hypothetical protein